MNHQIISPKKLIEVALPLDAINTAAAKEKAIRQGHPSSLHLWWARRPLAAARAVIFSQLINDPEDLWRCQNPGVEPNKQTRGHWTKARARLFKIIEELVLWENATNERVLDNAREEIRKSWREVCELNSNHPHATELFDPRKMPGLHDPFAGGGAIPLEAQRLGLEAYASDLNPVAVLINRAMIEFPPLFAGMAPVNPKSQRKSGLIASEWSGLKGVAEDVAYYGEIVRKAVEVRIGSAYPNPTITESITRTRPELSKHTGNELPVIAWIWVRTVPSPNPAFSSEYVPLASTFVLSQKKGSETYVVPRIEKDRYWFEVMVGPLPDHACNGTKLGRGNFACILSGAPISSSYIKEMAQAGKMKHRLMAIAAKAGNGRIYLSPTDEDEFAANAIKPPDNVADVTFFADALGFRIGNYGMSKWKDLFTNRQLLALTEFSDSIVETREQIINAARDARKRFPEQFGGVQDEASIQRYANMICVYLTFALDKLADLSNSLCRWESIAQCPRQLFGRQAIPMVWDFAEGNPLGDSSGSWQVCLDGISRAVDKCFGALPVNLPIGMASQADASSQTISNGKIISTDPPYYDNIGYADLSDFFYIWQRRTLKSFLPDLFATISVPKVEELVATPARHGGRESAEHFFLDGMTKVMQNLADNAHPAFPVTIFYAFKQSETTEESGTSSTGWITFLEAVLRAGFAIQGTWPMRTENATRLRGQSSNALASSVVLVCQKRDVDAPTTSRRDFVRELNSSLPIAVDAMTRESEGLPSPVAPVDLSQAVIGPGMSVFSKYAAVLEADGNPMTVETAYRLINRFLMEGDFDGDTQFCLHWFDQHGWEPGGFGLADVLARAKSTSVSGLVDAGVLTSNSGKVQLLRPADFSADWNPEKDHRIPIWEVLHQLIRTFRANGESAAGQLLSQPSIESRAEAARQLAYRLYTLCERKGWAEDARSYNELVTSWAAIESHASREPAVKQGELF